MGINTAGTSYDFGQLGSVHMHNDAGETLTPPDGMVIIAITCIDATAFDELKVETTKNSLVYSGTETNNAYFGITNANTGGNGEAIQTNISFPAGITIYGRWTEVSLNATQGVGGIIAYFGF